MAGRVAPLDAGLLRDPRLADGIRFHRFAQWEFEWEWMGLRAYANARGIRIIGDIPMYVAASSADVWADREQFCVDADGRPTLQAGTPPDAFAKDGQLWGNPCYRWDAMRADGYDWWMRRLARTFALYDVTRLDHFLGFQNYYGVRPAARRSRAPGMPAPASRCSAARTSFSASCPSLPRTWAR